VTRPHPAADRARAKHVEALDLALDWRTLTWRLARLLLEIEKERLHYALGYASFREYVVEALGLEARQVRDLLCTARRLVGLPKLSAEVEAGRLPWTKARAIGRAATPETEAAWIARAHEVTVHQLDEEVGAVLFGEPPPPPGTPSKKPPRVVLRFELEAADADLVQQALALVRSRCDVDEDDFDEGVALAAIAHHLLASAPPGEDAPTSEDYRFVLTECPTCRRTDGLEHAVSEAVVAEARCDAEVVDMRPGPDQGAAHKQVTDRLRRIVLHAYGWCCGVPTCRNRWRLQIHHIEPRSRGGGNEPGNLMPVCSVHHRIHHDGYLSIERRADGAVVFESATGRWVTHVGRRPTVEPGGSGGVA
jgi:hypothetical protein